MTDLDEYIIALVNDKGPIKAVDLALEVAKHRHGIGDQDMTESLNRLTAAGLIKEIEYILPNMNYRAKSIYFPEGTEILLVEPEHAQVNDATTAEKEFSDIIGMALSEATAKVSNRGISRIRPKIIDGKPQIVTMELRSDRLNVETMGKQITRILGTG